MYRTVDDISRLVDEEAERGNLSTALELIARFVADVIARETSLARVFSSPQLDRACLKLGRNFREREPAGRDSDQAVFLVTSSRSCGEAEQVCQCGSTSD